ncbi:MAG: hypothetical protein D6731_03630, partial [Planctomycetota bacterium]
MRARVPLVLVVAATLTAAGWAQDAPPASTRRAEATRRGAEAEGLAGELARLRRAIADLRAQLALQNRRLDEQARALAELRRLVRALQESPQREAIAEERRYREAVRILVGRRLAEYPRAKELLASIPANSPLRKDAEALLAWLGADLRVRAAQQAYDEGRASEALAALEEVLRLGVLGPNAREGVRVRRERFARVVRAFERGRELQRQGELEGARKAYAEVLALERNGMNRFRRDARQALAQLLAAASGQVLDECAELARGTAEHRARARETLDLLLDALPPTHPHRARAEALSAEL